LFGFSSFFGSRGEKHGSTAWRKLGNTGDQAYPNKPDKPNEPDKPVQVNELINRPSAFLAKE
jgi:hypothetical protein